MLEKLILIFVFLCTILCNIWNMPLAASILFDISFWAFMCADYSTKISVCSCNDLTLYKMSSLRHSVMYIWKCHDVAVVACPQTL